MIHLRPSDGGVAAGTPQTQQLREVAEKLETSFVAEMLKHAGLGETKSEFGGGHGETHFASFLRDEHAKALVQSGGIGLADQIFKSLVERSRD